MYRLSTLLGNSAEKFPDKIALVINQQCYTYQELYVLTHHLAASLLEKGISKGDCVAFLLPNSIEIILCYYACFMIGAIAVPVNIQFNNVLIHYVLKHSEACIFITTSDYYKQLLNDEKIVKEIKECYLTSEASRYSGTLDFQELLLPTQAPTSTTEIELEKPALLFLHQAPQDYPKRLYTVIKV